MTNDQYDQFWRLCSFELSVAARGATLNRHCQGARHDHMIKADRHARIMSILEDSQALTLPELARRLRPGVDRHRPARRGRARRPRAAPADTRPVTGTGTPPAAERPSSPSIEDQIGDVDAIILPPIEGRGADTLRGMARRRQIPFLAESSEQAGGVYVGPDNFAVGRELGKRAGAMLAEIRSGRRASCSSRWSGCPTRGAAATGS